MDKKIKLLSLLLMVYGMSFCWTACSNDSEDSETDEPVEYTGETEQLTRQDSLDVAFQSAVSTLCETDSIVEPSENYAPDYGTMLYKASPTVRYKMAENAEDALAQFRLAFAAAIEFAGANDDGTTVRIDFGEKGSIEFERTQGDGRMGILNVDIPQIPDLTQVVWLQTEAWPLNDGDGGTYIGQTFKSPQGFKWVCVRTPESSEYGLLVTFDDKQGAFWKGALNEIRDPACNGQDDVNGPGNPKWDGWQYLYFYSNDRDWISWTHGCYALADELRVLNMFMYNNDGTRYEKAVDVFSNTDFMSTELYNAIYTDGRYFCCDGYQWDVRTENKHEYKLWYYSTGYWFRKDQWREGTQKCTYKWCGSRWYIMRNHYWDSRVLDEQWNSFASRNVAGWNKDTQGNGAWWYNEWTSRNYDKSYDHVTYPKVVAYRFYGDFYNEKTRTYKDGFVNFDISGRR